MKTWEDVKHQVWKKTPNKEKSRSLLKLALLRLEAVEEKDKKRFATLAVKDYYEIIDHILEALMEVDGYKTLSHEAKVVFLREFYSGKFSKAELDFINRLRVMRNRISYEGLFIDYDFLRRNDDRVNAIIQRLVELLKSKV